MGGERGRQDPAPDGDTDVRRNSAGAIASEVRGGLSALLARFCKAGRSRRRSLGVCEGSAGAQMERSRSFLPPPAFPGGHRAWGCSPHRVRQGEEQRRGKRGEIGGYAFPRTKCFPHPKGGPPSCSPFGQTIALTSPPTPLFIGFFTPFSSSNFSFLLLPFFFLFSFFCVCVFFFSVCCC